MRTKKTVAVLFSLIILLVCFLPGWGQSLKFKYTIFGGDTVSESVSSKKLPNNENEFKLFLDTLGDSLKFKDFDGIKYWLYIDIVNDVIGWGNNYLKASSEILRATNEWLEKHYLKGQGKKSY